MYKFATCIAVLLLLAAPALAANLTLYSTGNTTSSLLVNTRQNLTVFNFTVRALDTDVSISAMNITLPNITSSATPGNISKVFVFNGSTGTSPVGTNSSIAANLSLPSRILVNFSTIINLTNMTSTVFIVQYEISSSAKSGTNIAGNLSGTGDIVVNSTTSVFANVSLPNSTVSTIVDVHANASILPRTVDTGVENQTFVYTIAPTGADRINSTVINIPSGYTLTKLASVEYEGTNSSSVPTNATSSNQINVSFNTATGGTASVLRVYFTANTSTSPVPSSDFNSTVFGNVTNVATDSNMTNQTNVTTMNIINATTVSIHKGVAIINGTSDGTGSDYWEFNLTFNFNATVTGILHFRMTNWTDTGGRNISYTTCSPSCATLRSNINASLNTSKINITNAYDPNYGISMSPTIGNLTTLYLRMILPAGTPISQTWSATYFALFRSAP